LSPQASHRRASGPVATGRENKIASREEPKRLQCPKDCEISSSGLKRRLGPKDPSDYEHQMLNHHAQGRFPGTWPLYCTILLSRCQIPSRRLLRCTSQSPTKTEPQLTFLSVPPYSNMSGSESGLILVLIRSEWDLRVCVSRSGGLQHHFWSPDGREIS
jgi:hypothetical protein